MGIRKDLLVTEEIRRIFRPQGTLSWGASPHPASPKSRARPAIKKGSGHQTHETHRKASGKEWSHAATAIARPCRDNRQDAEIITRCPPHWFSALLL